MVNIRIGVMFVISFLLMCVLVTPDASATSPPYSYDLDVNMDIEGHFYDDEIIVDVNVEPEFDTTNCDYCDMGLKFKFYYSENGEDWELLETVDKVCDISQPVTLEHTLDVSDIERGTYDIKVIVSIDQHRGEDIVAVTIGHNPLDPQWFALGIILFVLIIFGLLKYFGTHREFP